MVFNDVLFRERTYKYYVYLYECNYRDLIIRRKWVWFSSK